MIVSGALTGNGSYATLSSALYAHSNVNQSGAGITVRVVANTTESSTAILMNGNWGTLTINSGGGTVSGNYAGPLIRMQNVIRVNIQGLVFTNHSTSSASDVSTIQFGDGCSRINVSGCAFYGAGKSPSSGTISILGYGIGAGDIIINGCNILALPGTTQGNGIYATATGTGNSNNTSHTFSNNVIRDCFLPNGDSHGIYVGPGNALITNYRNSIQNTSVRTHVGGGRWCGIALDESMGNGYNVVDGNTISGHSLVGAGAQSKLIPLMVYNGFGPNPTDVKNNKIENISLSGPVSGVGLESPFIGILYEGEAARIGVNGGNRVGKTNSAGNIQVNSSSTLPMEIYGIYCEGVGYSRVVTSGIGGIAVNKTGDLRGLLLFSTVGRQTSVRFSPYFRA